MSIAETYSIKRSFRSGMHVEFMLRGIDRELASLIGVFSG